MIICIPSGITDVEKRAVRDSAEHTGAKEVYMISEPLAAAIGIGIDIEAPLGSMIVDIGGGTTEIAVIALSGIVCDQSIRTAGDVFSKDILDHMRKIHNLLWSGVFPCYFLFGCKDLSVSGRLRKSNSTWEPY